jgi:hypothetical protein
VKFFSFFLVFALFLNSVPSNAKCDWSNDIKENPNGTFTYTRECHIEVGKNFKSVSLLNEKVELLEKKLDLKDFQITRYEERTQLWMDTSFKLNDKLMTYEATKKNDFWISFGLGILTTIATGYLFNEISK